MGSLRFSEYADSPTIFLPPPPKPPPTSPRGHPFYPSSYTHLIQHHQPRKPVMEPESAISTQSKQMSTASQPSPRSSRKRSRDESSGDYAAFLDLKVQRPCSSESLRGQDSMDTEVWSGASTLCQSQTRSWPAGQSERQYQSPPVHQGLISNEGADGRRKFQRHDLAQNVSTESTNRPGSQLFSSSGESSHDPISLQLGLSWKGISEDSDKQAAARGWAKVIERRYTIDGVRVLARHTDDLLMVEARDGIYVFDRDINRGTRIAETWTHCVEGLLSNQSFVWEGRELLHPNESPASSEAGGLWDTDDRDADMVSTLSTFQSPCTPPPPTSPAILSDPEPWSPDSLYPTGNMLDFHQPDGPSTTSDGNGLETEDIEMAVD